MKQANTKLGSTYLALKFCKKKKSVLNQKLLYHIYRHLSSEITHTRFSVLQNILLSSIAFTLYLIFYFTLYLHLLYIRESCKNLKNWY